MIDFVQYYIVKKSINLMWLRVWDWLNSYIKPKLMCFALQIYKSSVNVLYVLLNFRNIYCKIANLVKKLHE